MSEIFSAEGERPAPVSPISQTGGVAEASATTTGSIEKPAVVAVVVTSDPGDHFAEVLGSLGSQDYENLSVLVVDAGSEHPIADRVAGVLPDAYLHRIAGDPGWSVAANQSIELVSGSPFLLFCHDDVALDPNCVSNLMSALYRNNGGVAGPKLVEWDDERRLLQLGMSSDRFGVQVDQVDRREFDQGQYDAVRDVFVVPGGVQLIRADLFAALGGFDTEIKSMGEDLDFCWRAHIAGARVLVVPNARARHLESMGTRISVREKRRLATRHRIRSMYVTANRRAFLTTVPIGIALLLLESFVALITGRRAQAKDVLSAIPWNLARSADIRRRRRQLARLRTEDESVLQDLYTSGSARIAAFSRGQVAAGQDRVSGLVGTVRSSFAGEDTGSARDATVIGTFLLLVLIFGSRHLLTRGVVPVGEFPDVPAAGTLAGEWLGGWRSVGVGGPGNAPTALLILAVGRLLFFWSPGLFDTLLVVAPVFIGPIGVYRLARPLGSPRAGAIGAVVYAGCPLVTSTMVSGRWEALVIWAATPYIFGTLLRIAGVTPFGVDGGPAGLRVVDRSVPVRLVRFGMLVAFVAAFATAVIPVAFVMALGVALGSFLSRGQWRDVGIASLVAIVAPVALHAPWSLDTIRQLSWRWLVGPTLNGEGDYSTMLDLVQFARRSQDVRWLAIGAVVAAALSLAVAKRHLLVVAVQGWSVALLALGLTWLGIRGWLPFSMPTPEATLAPVAGGFALAVIGGIRTIELELLAKTPHRQYKLAAVGGGAAVAAVMLTGIVSGVHGGWNAPTSNFTEAVNFFGANRDDVDPARIGRVLWIGDASVLPIDAMRTESGIEYAVSDAGSTDVRSRWQAGSVGPNDGIGLQLELAQSGEVVRLGRLLAPYGIDLVVVVDKLAPRPYEGPTADVGVGIEQALSQQLDLERLAGAPDIVIFQNISGGGVAPLLPVSDVTARTAADQLDVDLSQGSATMFNVRPGEWRVLAPAGSQIHVALDQFGLEAPDQPGIVLSPGFDDMTVIAAIDTEAEVSLLYTQRWRRRLGIFVQFVLVSFGALMAQTRREELI